ncbi:MAG: hypothetical protein ACW99G_14705 [Candidatus Thorarchaeota archaeon]|jgi:hypothetical protein
MIEEIELVSAIHPIFEGISDFNTELNLVSEPRKEISLVSQIFPELDEVSQIDLEEV